MPETRIEWGILTAGLVVLLALGATIGLSARDDGGSSAEGPGTTLVRSPGGTAPLAPPAVKTTRSAARSQAATPKAQPRRAEEPRPTPVPAATTPTAPAARPAVRTAAVRLSLGATRGDSWLEVRSGSSTGPVLFSGTLAQGMTRTFRASRLWVRFGGASNLDARLNGHALALRFGTYDTLVTPSGLARPA